jgi:hypothetical protein
VVEHDVEEHADPGRVKGVRQRPELPGRIRRIHAVTRMRAEEAVRAVSPVVPQAARERGVWNVLFVEGHHRQQLDVRDAEFLQVGDLLDEPGERAGTSNAARGIAREAADVQLVHDRALERARHRPGGRRRCSGDDRAHLRVAGVEPCDDAAAVPPRIAHGLRPWVEQELALVECAAGRGRIVRPVDAPRVTGTWPNPFDEHVPEEERAVLVGRKTDRLHRLRIRAVRVEQQLDARGVAAEHAEIHAVRRNRGTRRESRSGSGAERAVLHIGHTQLVISSRSVPCSCA